MKVPILFCVEGAYHYTNLIVDEQQLWKRAQFRFKVPHVSGWFSSLSIQAIWYFKGCGVCVCVCMCMYICLEDKISRREHEQEFRINFTGAFFQHR